MHDFPRCLTLGNLRAEKEKCHISKRDVYEHAEGSYFIIIPPDKLSQDFEFEFVFQLHVRDYQQNLPNLYLAATKYYTGDDAKRLFLLAELGIPLVATNDVHYHHAARRELQDVLPASARNAPFLMQATSCIKMQSGTLRKK
jgi:error-prone DNA polymerase